MEPGRETAVEVDGVRAGGAATMCQCVSVHACMREKRERAAAERAGADLLGGERAVSRHNQTSRQMKHELFPSSENIEEPASLDRPPGCRATGPSGTGMQFFYGNFYR